MATLETQQLDEVIASSRRRMLTLGGAAVAGLFLTSAASAATTLGDADYLNFALNLEYLEANFYTLAATGQTVDEVGIGITGVGTSGAVTTKPGGPTACAVPFKNSLVQSYAMEIAQEERNHVSFLRSALNSAAVAQPAIDLYNSFNGLAALLGITGVTAFDPFADDASFLLGSYIFEDVGVTAYTGAAPLLTTPAYLDAAAGIQGVEAYHAGLVRTTILGLDQGSNMLGALGVVKAGTLIAVADAISMVRAKLDGTGTTASPYGDDLGLAGQTVALNGTTVLNASSFVNATTTDTTYTTDSLGNPVVSSVSGTGTNGSMVVPRTPAQVLSIVYASGKDFGRFLPMGLNGTIK